MVAERSRAAVFRQHTGDVWQDVVVAVAGGLRELIRDVTLGQPRGLVSRWIPPGIGYLGNHQFHLYKPNYENMQTPATGV